MSKISFVNPENAKNLLKSGTALFLKNSTVFSRKRIRPPKRFSKKPSHAKFNRSLKRSEVNALTRSISDHWHTLSVNQRAVWSEYSTHFANFTTGFQAFFSNNTRLLRSGFESFGWVDDITCAPISVDQPTGISSTYMQGSASFCMIWTAPLCTTLFIQVFEWIPPGFMRSREQRWKYVNTCLSVDGSISVPVIFLDTGRKALLTIRAINLRGECSTLPGYNQPTKTTMQLAYYGGVYYGYAFYSGS